MSDLLVPIIFIIVMFILIDYFGTWIPLMVTGFLFIPVSWLFVYQLRDGLYTEMFGADISVYLTDVPGLETILSLTMFIIPLIAFLKMYWVTKMLNTGHEQNG